MAARRTSARGGGRVQWDRVGRIALLLVLAGMAYLYVGPASAWISTYGEARQQRERVAKLEERRARLQRRARELRDPAVLEREARRLGMVRPGERPYVIEGLRGSE